MVRSGRLQRDPPLVKRMAALLLESMQSKSFLREASAAALAELLEGASDADFLAAFKEVEGLEAVVQAPAESATPEVELSQFQTSTVSGKCTCNVVWRKVKEIGMFVSV